MKLLFTLTFFLFGIVNTNAQISNVQEEFPLPASLSESSGAIMINGKLITHNDSGGQNELYELDLNTQTVTRTVTISNATHIDWEDITQDDTHIYIGDFGNNNGDRTDLKIYKILKTDYLNSTSVTAEIINFSYANQSNFTSNPQNTPWDAEAILSLNTTDLVVISKNWVNGVSSAYIISKTPGTYSLAPLPSTLNSGGLITGATFNTLSRKIYLVGYTTVLQPFIWSCDNFSSNDIFSGNNTQTMLLSLQLEQTEAITYTSEKDYLLTSERFSRNIGGFTFSDAAKLVSFSSSDTTLSLETAPTNSQNITLYPNPVSQFLHIKGNHVTFVQLLNMQSAPLYKNTGKTIDMSLYSSGVYMVKINLSDGSYTLKRVVKL